MSGIDNIRSGGHSIANTSRREQRTDNDTNAQKSSSSARSQGTRGDAVSLSNQSRAMSEMQAKLASSPAFDNAKVKAIKEAIANGSYVVDPEKLAENMIKLEKELGGLS